VSADVANAYSSEFIQFSLKRKFDSSAYARDFLSSQLQQTKGKQRSSVRSTPTPARQASSASSVPMVAMPARPTETSRSPPPACFS
jgi:hypothetical protein